MIIDDSTNLKDIPEDGQRGYVPRDFAAQPTGSLPYAAPFQMDLIPEEQWPDLIADMDRNKTSLLDLCEDAGLKPMDQANTNYCWAYGVIDCVQIIRMVQGEAMVPLSPDSVAAPLTNYANARGRPAGVGGWPSKALAYLVEHGIDTQAGWPLHRIDKSLDTPESRERRKNFNVTEWIDGTPSSTSSKQAFAELMTCLLLRIPCGSAHDFMHHVISPAKPVFVNGQFGFKARNSGYGRDRTGHITLLGRRAVPDEWVAPRVALAY